MSIPTSTDRFEIRRELGRGGMGAVYAAYDRERKELVALKTLLSIDPDSIYKLKREFRALADISHQNLVPLYELVADGSRWFFTMELVKGVDFLSYTRPKSEPGKPGAIPDSRRLRDALAQLVGGVAFLHSAGKLHRDLKPSNVMVTDEGRVVILDFGLTTDLDPGTTLTTESGLAGSVPHISPEQVNGTHPTEASDWYAVGVMLYQALTGRLPYAGNTMQVLAAKCSSDPDHPRQLVPDAPSDLADLAMALLERDPARRMSGSEIFACTSPSVSEPQPEPYVAHRTDLPLIGRDEHLAALENAFVTARGGRAVMVCAYGKSGIGKSALVRHFIEGLRGADRALVLEGRCYEREAVPYKALDGLIDSLSRYLRSLSPAKAEALLPRDILALSRLFPVLLHVEAVANAPYRPDESPDPWEQRRRAFGALRELLTRIADRQPLVLWIDDLQWADADSTVLLKEMLGIEDPPPLLLLVSFRSEEMETKPFLATLLENAGTETARALQIGPVPQEEAQRLAMAILGPELAGIAGNEKLARNIASEAGGSPFFLEQMARHAIASGGTVPRTSLTEMIQTRMSQLPAEARRLVEVVAVSGKPIQAAVAALASSLHGDERPLLVTLRAAHLLRSSGSADRIEIYHDRIRENLASQLPEERIAAIHGQLADAMEKLGVDDPEALYDHHLGAGRRQKAGTQAVLAARKAAQALAFDRAVLFYERALEYASLGTDETRMLQRELGNAFANAGRSANAARAYQSAAADAPAHEAVELRQLAAEQLLLGGYVDEGLSVMREVLRTAGFSLASGPRGALLRLVMRRIQLRLRGLRFRQLAEHEVPPAQLRHIDVCWTVAVGLSFVDNIRAAEFQTRHLLLALRAGEPYRIARAISVEAAFSSSPGSHAGSRPARLLSTAQALAHSTARPHAIGLSNFTAGMAAYLAGRWREAATHCEHAIEVLRDQCTGVAWELTSAQRFYLSSLIYLGEADEVSRRLPLLINGWQDRGNLYGVTDLRTRMNFVWLAADDPQKARQEVESALKAWSNTGFHLQHYNGMLALTQVDLYEGNGAAAWERVSTEWPRLTRSMLMRIQVLRVEAYYLRARCALLAAATAADPLQLLQEAERCASHIAGESASWADPLVYILRAALPDSRRTLPAQALLERAAHSFRVADMGLHAAAATRRAGELAGGPAGTAKMREADELMKMKGILNPEKVGGLLVPSAAVAAGRH